MVKADYNFIAEGQNEMSLKKGDVVRVTKKIDEGWWIGTCNGKSGMFPSNYVSSMSDVNFENGNHEVLNIKIKLKPELNEIYDDSKLEVPVHKSGFSYLPQGTPITFIGRKIKPQSNSLAEVKVETISLCCHCKCDEFVANVFKPLHCNNCFHKH